MNFFSFKEEIVPRIIPVINALGIIASLIIGIFVFIIPGIKLVSALGSYAGQIFG